MHVLGSSCRHHAPALLVPLALALAACTEEPRAEYLPPPDTQADTVCDEPEPEVPDTFFQIAGIVEEVDYWDCEHPDDGDGDFTITNVSGTEAVVTGSTAEFSIGWDGPQDIAGRNLLFWIGSGGSTHVRNGMVVRSGSARGYYRWVIPDDVNPLLLDFLLHPDARSGDVQLNFAIDDTIGDPIAPRIGAQHSRSLYVIDVGNGDIQINLNWNTLVDLDMWVTDPDGFRIFYGAKTSPSGGNLDLDSYPACRFEGDRGRGNENVFWPVDRAPSGQYLVQVNMFSDCETYANGVPTHYRVTVVNEGDVQTYEGTFAGQQSEQLHDVVTFTY